MNFDFLDQIILGNALSAYMVTIAWLLGGSLAILILQTVVLNSLRRWAKIKKKVLNHKLVKIIGRSLVRLLYVGNIFFALGYLEFPNASNFDRAVQATIIIATTIILTQLISQLLEYGIRTYLSRKGNIDLEQSFGALMPIIRMVLWSIGIIFLLDNLGFNISAIVASLGIGGLAIAFAAQGILTDLFSYFTIIFDRPFVIGDFLVIEEFRGTVEYIGIKTTRIRSFTGEEIVMANTDLTGSRIRNYKRMHKRRVEFHLGVVYETPQEKLEIIPTLIQDIIDEQQWAIFDRAHFFSYGDFSLDYEIIYYVRGKDYNLYMDIQQKINLGIFEAFAQRDIEFAYPTNVTYVQGLNSETPSHFEKVLAER